MSCPSCCPPSPLTTLLSVNTPAPVPLPGKATYSLHLQHTAACLPAALDVPTTGLQSHIARASVPSLQAQHHPEQLPPGLPGLSAPEHGPHLGQRASFGHPAPLWPLLGPWSPHSCHRWGAVTKCRPAMSLIPKYTWDSHSSSLTSEDSTHSLEPQPVPGSLPSKPPRLPVPGVSYPGQAAGNVCSRMCVWGGVLGPRQAPGPARRTLWSGTLRVRAELGPCPVPTPPTLDPGCRDFRQELSRDWGAGRWLPHTRCW